MRVGPLRHLCRVEKLSPAKDAFGGIVNTWELSVNVWCSIAPVSGKESWMSAQKYETATHTVFCRYTDKVTPKMRMLFGTRVFDIVAVMNVQEQNKMLKLVVEETV